jgi:hypothetical protein
MIHSSTALLAADVDRSPTARHRADLFSVNAFLRDRNSVYQSLVIH